MTPEELDRRMEFIIEHQAHFAAQIDQLREEDERLRQADERLRQEDERRRESQATLTAALLRIAELVEDVGEAQKRSDEQLRKTDERLNALISVVEKHISGGDGHRPPA